MIKYLRVILFLLVYFMINQPLLPQSCIYSWSPQNSGTQQLLYTCKAVSETVCWAAGANATVLLTTDGGDNWLNANPNPGVITGDVRNMEALDETTAFVTTEISTSTSVYKTTDGGDSWVLVYSNTGGTIKGIRMLDSLNGIAIGSPISNIWNLLLTTDGGKSWQLSPNSPSAENIHQAVHNSFQVSMPYIYWGTSFSSVFRSSDGGLTFSENETPGAGIYIFSLFINSGGVGMAAATAMCRSTDGGVTFLSHPVPGAGNINAIQSAGNDFWYIRGTKIYHSTDDGINWIEEYDTPSGLSLNHMDFPDSLSECQTGWAVGFGGSIHKMTGSTITTVDNPSETLAAFELSQNYPNPFNPRTKIKFQIPLSPPLLKGESEAGGFITLKVYDMLGNEVATLVNEQKSAGTYEVSFNASELVSGIYFYKLTARELSTGSGQVFSKIKKMILLR